MCRNRNLVCIFLIIALAFVSYHSFHEYLPCVMPTAISDPAVQPLVDVLEFGYATLGQAYLAQDINVLADAFINHPSYRLAIGWSHSATVRSFISDVSGPNVARNFGYLTAMQNKLTFRMQGDQLLRAKLAESGRGINELTDAEWGELAAQNRGDRPTLLSDDKTAANSHAPQKRIDEIYAVHLCSGKAELSYSNGVTGERAILLRRNDKWYIAAIYR